MLKCVTKYQQQNLLKQWKELESQTCFCVTLIQYKLTNNKIVRYENIFIQLWHVKSFYFSLLVYIL